MCYIVEMELYVGDEFDNGYKRLRITNIGDFVITYKEFFYDQSEPKVSIMRMARALFEYLYESDLDLESRKKILFQKEIGKL